MNDREMFWSLISPHLVDRPDVTNRFNYGLDEVIGNWHDLSRFVIRNHKLILPSEVRWMELPQRTVVEWGASELRDTYTVIPLDQHPNKMVILRANKISLGMRVARQLFFDLRDAIVEIRLTQMHHSKTDYVMGNMQVYGKPLRDDADWPYIIDVPGVKKGLYQYAVWPTMPSFINWNNDPFTLK